MLKSNMSSFTECVSNVVIKRSNKGGRLPSKVMTTSPSFMGTSKYVSWSAKDFTLLLWSRILTPSSIVMVKNLHLMNKMLDKILISWMLYKIFHAYTGFLYPLIYADSLATRFMAMMMKAFLPRRSYAFLTTLLAVDGGGNSDSSTI